LIGMGQDRLEDFEPAYADELSAIMAWGFEHMQKPDGSSVYLRLSTRGIAQPARTLTDGLKAQIFEGGYWLREPKPGCELAIAYAGAIAPEAIAAHDAILEDVPGAGLLAITSPGRLHAGWTKANRARAKDRNAPLSAIEKLLAPLSPGAALVTVHDGHPAALSWIAGAGGLTGAALGVEKFGQSGNLPDLFRTYGIDTDAILDACAEASLRRLRG